MMSKINFESILHNELFSEEVILKLKTQKLHVVVLAVAEDSLCAKYLNQYLKMGMHELSRYCDAVNENVDPGCLYPKFTFTLFPTKEHKVDVKKCVIEMMKAQENYFKTPEMLLAFDETAADFLLEVKQILESELKQTSDNLSLKTVYYPKYK